MSTNRFLPNLTSRTIHTWLTQIDPDRFFKASSDVMDSDYLLGDLCKRDNELNDRINSIEEAIKNGEFKKMSPYWMKQLCDYKKERRQIKAALLAEIINHNRIIMQNINPDLNSQDLNKIEQGAGKLAKIFSDPIGYKDSALVDGLNTASDAIKAVKISIQENVSAQNRVELIKITFDLVTRYTPLPDGVSNFGGFFKFYSESLNVISKKIGEIENNLDNKKIIEIYSKFKNRGVGGLKHWSRLKKKVT